jgi:hypothetical protein
MICSGQHDAIKRLVIFIIALAAIATIGAFVVYSTTELPHRYASSVAPHNAGTGDINDQTCAECRAQVAATCSGKNPWDWFWCSLWGDFVCNLTKCPSNYVPVPAGP